MPEQINTTDTKFEIPAAIEALGDPDSIRNWYAVYVYAEQMFPSALDAEDPNGHLASIKDAGLVALDKYKDLDDQALKKKIRWMKNYIKKLLEFGYARVDQLGIEVLDSLYTELARKS